jgi:hypothetical protein
MNLDGDIERRLDAGAAALVDVDDDEAGGQPLPEQVLEGGDGTR